MERHFLKRMNAQKLQSSVQFSWEGELLMNDSDHKVNGYRDPDLGLHCIRARAEIVFDTEVTLDPTEEEFHLPTHLVKACYGDGRNVQVVGQEDEILPALWVEEAHLAKRARERLSCFGKSWLADLIAPETSHEVHGERSMASKAKVLFGPSDKESPCRSNPAKSGKIHIGSIHDVEGTRLEEELVEPANVVLTGFGDVDAGRDRASEIQLGMHLDPCLGAAEVGPWEECQGEIDGGGVQSVNRVLQFQSQIFSSVKRASLAHETTGEILPESPVPLLVGICQGGLGNLLAEAQMVERFGSGVEAGGDVAQSFPPCQLRKGHTDELLATAKMANSTLRIVALDETGKRLPVNQIEDLRENETARVHGHRSSSRNSQSSNPSHPFCFARL